MSRRHGLGRLLVALSVVTLLSVTGGWALGAPASPTDQTAIQPLVQVTADVQLRAERRSLLLQRQETLGEEAETGADAAKSTPRPHLLAAIESDMQITDRPGGGKTVGTMPAGSRYYGTGHRAWVLDTTEDGRYGKVAVPYRDSQTTGWIRLAGLDMSHTEYSVEVDLSAHQIVVKRLDKTVLRMPAATGAASSPTPTGRYFVADLVPIPGGGSFGTYAFGLSGIQPNLPAGWGGGDQLAIHGTGDPSSIGTSASAGCLRVSERALDQLKAVLRLGTPVVMQP